VTSRDRQKPSCQQGFGVMAADILRMNIIAKFELWSFVSTVVLKCRHYAKPRTVVQHAEKANAQIGTFGFCRPSIQTQKTKRAYFFAYARTE